MLVFQSALGSENAFSIDGYSVGSASALVQRQAHGTMFDVCVNRERAELVLCPAAQMLPLTYHGDVGEETPEFSSHPLRRISLCLLQFQCGVPLGYQRGR